MAKVTEGYGRLAGLKAFRSNLPIDGARGWYWAGGQAGEVFGGCGSDSVGSLECYENCDV